MREPVKGATMCATFVGDVMLVVHAEVAPAADEWSAYCNYAGATRAMAAGNLKTLVITVSDGGPNARQRSEYKDKVAGTGNRVAVLCGGSVTRAILTAMSWFNPDMQAFGVDEINRALSYLGASPSEDLMRALEQSRLHLGLTERRHTA